jgi:hypothetical protein
MSGPISAEPRSVSKRRVLGWALAVVYLVMLVGIVVSMFQLREVTLETMGTPEARAEWEAWRQAAPNQRKDQPVERRPPKSDEPPALVLMRDHFPVMLGGAVVFSSLLYGALAFALRGAIAGSDQSQNTPSKSGD